MQEKRPEETHERPGIKPVIRAGREPRHCATKIFKYQEYKKKP